MPSNLADAGPRRFASEARPPPTTSSILSPGRDTPPISEVGEQASNEGESQSRPPPASRLRSNLADHNQPPALQPPSRPNTTTSEGGPPRSISGTGPAKKKPISKRYVRVD